MKKDSLEILGYKKRIGRYSVLYMREDDISSKSIEFNLKDKVIHISFALEKIRLVGVSLTMFEFRAIEDISKVLGLYDFGRNVDVKNFGNFEHYDTMKDFIEDIEEKK